MHRFVMITSAALLLAAGACHTGTAYIPRTPGRAALGMVNGEPGIYKDGRLLTVSAGASMSVQCSPAATSAAVAAAGHHTDYKRNTSLSAVGYGLGVFFPPAYAMGGYFGVRAAVDQQESHAAQVDAINLHNDDAGCQ